MTDDEWVLIDKIQGQFQAEIIKGLLEAQGIQVWLNSQGAARAYAVTVGTLGAVELLVPSSQADQAREIMEEYNRGDFENMKLDDSEPPEGSEE